MNLENYKILKLSNKEMIICEMSSECTDFYEVINPLKMDVLPKLSKDGQVNEVLNLRPWMQHLTEQKYVNINKQHCILIVDASVGLSKYYEHIIKKIDEEWDEDDILTQDVDEYDDLLMEAETDSKLIH
tara:strand:+ start:170 stop:556 length:387 start_codon:yes stop_codon:yes gene_type:complete